MTSEDRKIQLSKEANRLINYQHQHRGLSFIKLLLPPTTERKVNLVGFDNHIYRGSVPKIPEDKLPPDVDEKSIDEEALYKEIRDMNFPPVPVQEPLGPSRRIGGSYTLAKKLSLAPVKVECGEGLHETPILGKDGGIYKGTLKYPSKVELDKRLKGTKSPIKKVRQQSSSRGSVEPSLILLQTDGKPVPIGRRQKSLVELPAANVGKIIELVLRKKEKVILKDSAIAKKDEAMRDREESDQIKEREKTRSEDMKTLEEFENTKNTEEFKSTKDTEESDEGTEGTEESDESTRGTGELDEDTRGTEETDEGAKDTKESDEVTGGTDESDEGIRGIEESDEGTGDTGEPDEDTRGTEETDEGAKDTKESDEVTGGIDESDEGTRGIEESDEGTKDTKESQDAKSTKEPLET